MKLITKPILNQLKKNAAATLEAQTNDTPEPDHKPPLKLFGGSAGTWLFTELLDDGDTLYGLCDLGHGSPEIGYVSLSELAAVRFPPFGLPIERDRGFKPSKTIRAYAEEARAAGYIKT